MSDINQARRTTAEIFFADINITSSIRKYLISLTYTDNEEDETDDLQIKLQDREGIWLTEWLDTVIQTAAEPPNPSSEFIRGSQYRVTASSGLAIHSGAGSQYSIYGALTYGTIITVSSISGEWANFTYSGNNAYVNASYLELVYEGTEIQSSTTSWNIGDEVTATGRAQYTSYGEGTPGATVTNYKGTITYLNLKSGVPYPIHVGQLGWFAENQVQKTAETTQTIVESKVDRGLRIQATIVRQNWNSDGKDDVLDCGQFELDSVVATGPPATINIKGTSLPYSSTVRQTIKSKSWEAYTLSGIANEIALTNGMACMYLSPENPYYTRIEQYQISDISFLQKLCQDAGCSLKVTNNIIVIFEQATYETKSSVRTIERGKNGGYTKYKLSTNENDKYTSCRVSYVTSTGENITATAYIDGYDTKSEKNQCLVINQKVSSVAEAMTLAEKQLRLHNKYAIIASFTFPGDPRLLAGCTVMLESWGAWSGKYIIKQAKHSISASGYTTQIELRKALANADNDIGETEEELSFEVGDKVMCNPGVTTFYSGVSMASWVTTATLYVRQIEQDGKVLLVSTEPDADDYIGRVNASDVHKI